MKEPEELWSIGEGQVIKEQMNLRRMKTRKIFLVLKSTVSITTNGMIG
jgi:hypothetical protein